MRIERPRYTERFGSVRINEVQHVLELDSGKAKALALHESIAVHKVEEEVIKGIEEKMAIVIPIRDDNPRLLEGVISGVPHECLIIVVSNSCRQRPNIFRAEQDTLRQFCHFTGRRALVIHQKDPVLAQALREAGYTDLSGEDGQVRDGRAEGMVAAILMAMAARKEYVGFVDADNYLPGAVWEYVRCFAAGISMARSPYLMVRVLWRYKASGSTGMYLKRWGPVSEITNRCLNSLISSKTGFETEVIQTANARAHAMSTRLAEILPYASGYAMEPQELVSIFEEFGGVLPVRDRTVAGHGVEVCQIQTKNPRLRDSKGRDHLEGMLLPSLGAIYHSPLCEEDTRQMVINELLRCGAISADEQPLKPSLSRPLEEIDLPKFNAIMEDHLESCLALKEKRIMGARRNM
jgi:mannosyl-3-phosphoglycerate synthase